MESRRVAALVRRAPEVESGRVVAIVRWLECNVRMPARIRLVAPDVPVEPGVYGILRPVLLWPSALTDRLSDSQIAAIAVHELAHVQRLDNLTAVLHRAIATVFWFHPVVWMIGRRLEIERERACDEAVLERGSEPRAYAAGILETCRVCLAAPAGVAGVSGPELKSRIERIVTCEAPAALTVQQKALLVAAALVMVAFPVAAAIQSSTSAPQTALTSADAEARSFEVASIKPKGAGGGMVLMQVLPGGRVNIANASARLLIRQAHRVQDYQIVGGPRWMNTDHFDIAAKAAGNPSQSDLQAMLRALLIDRFQLVTRGEQRELPIYALVPAPGNAAPRGLRPATPCFTAPLNLPPQQLPLGETPCGFRLSPGRLAGHGVTMGALAISLANLAGRMVVDRTGRNEEFDFELAWTPFQAQAPLDPSAAPDRPVDAGPSLFTAIQEQLGLRLQSDRAPVDVLVVDRLERPTPD